MRVILIATAYMVLAAATPALAQSTVQRLTDPTVKGQPIDHCADIDGEDDCAVGGQQRAALKACAANGFTDQAGFHWRPATGTAMHYITEYDMHAGEIGGRWALQPTAGTFDWIDCKK